MFDFNVSLLHKLINKKLSIMQNFIENIQDLKDNREDIIDQIKVESEIEDMEFVKQVMQQMVHIVTSSNYKELDYDVYDLVYHSVVNVKNRIDMSSFQKIQELREESLKNQLPSSMR